MLRTALTLAARGMAVFPCLPRAKEPATAHGCKDATVDLDQIRVWWTNESAYNVAIATGAASKVFVLDIDGLGAEAELRKLEAAHGALPPSVETITPRGPGRHIYFRWPDVTVRNSASKIAPGIDVRGEGGYVLAPPSIHPTGRAYSWSVDSTSAFAEAPEWLLDKIRERTNGSGTAPSTWRDLVGKGVDEGQRDSVATRLAGYFLRRHLDPLVVLEILQLWNAQRCRPPLPCEDIERIVDSIAGRETKRRSHGN